MHPADEAPTSPLAEAGTSQAVKAQLRLREMVLAGELPGGGFLYRDGADAD